jgi:nicotinate phosphoribosyltransferase
VAKTSPDKRSVGGRKWALRRRSADGTAEAEVLGITRAARKDANDRELLVPLIREGEIVGREPLDAARDRHAASLAELPETAVQLSKGEPCIPTVYEEG